MQQTGSWQTNGRTKACAFTELILLIKQIKQNVYGEQVHRIHQHIRNSDSLILKNKTRKSDIHVKWPDVNLNIFKFQVRRREVIVFRVSHQ